METTYPEADHGENDSVFCLLSGSLLGAVECEIAPLPGSQKRIRVRESCVFNSSCRVSRSKSNNSCRRTFGIGVGASICHTLHYSVKVFLETTVQLIDDQAV